MRARTFPKHKNVFRIITGNTVGWQVRIERNKRQYNRLFSDGVYGTTEAALRAALAWRDGLLDLLPPHRISTAHLRTKRNKRKAAQAMNRTGVIGIGFSMHTQRSGNQTPYVTCHWRDDETGRRCSTSFSIEKHGLRAATMYACKRLREGQGQSVSINQLNYMVRKALPNLEALYQKAVASEPSTIE